MTEQRVKQNQSSSHDSISSVKDQPEQTSMRGRQLEIPISLIGGGTDENLNRWLRDSRLSRSQRQTLATQISRVQGNHHLQRVFAVHESEKSISIRRGVDNNSVDITRQIMRSPEGEGSKSAIKLQLAEVTLAKTKLAFFELEGKLSGGYTVAIQGGGEHGGSEAEQKPDVTPPPVQVHHRRHNHTTKYMARSL
jgi:hypothetical protein